MNTRPTNVRHEESRSARNEDYDSHSILRSRIEEERRKRRLEWQRQQERQHEKLKQRKILEYERKRAQALGYPEPKSVHHNRSRSSSNSPQYRHRGRSSTSASKSSTLFEKLEGFTSGTIPLFKDSDEDIQYNITELRRIKFNIRRNIPVKGPIPELQQSIVNAEDIILTRRRGEGAKPIFDRKEIKECAKINELKERPTLAVIDEEYQSEDSALHISTTNPTRSTNDRRHEESRSAHNEDHDSHSILRSRTEEERLRRRRLEWQRQQERERQYEKLKQRKILEYERKRAQALGYSEPKSVHHSRSKSSRKGSKPLFHKEKIKKAAEINEVEERPTVTVIDEKYRSDLTDKSQTYKKRSLSSSSILYGSEYLSSHQSSRTSRTRSLIEERSYRDRYRDRSNEHSRERKDRDRDRDRSRERRDVASHYIESPIHVPICYNLPPRPIVYPLIPFRGVPPMGRGQNSALIALNRPLPPRFIPPNMYRLRPPPPNLRYKPF